MGKLNLMNAALGLEALADQAYQANRDNNQMLGALQLLAIFFMVAISTLKPWKKAAKK